jgi:hypothetical protein
MERGPLRGAPNTVAVTEGAERIADFIPSSNAWPRSGGTADFVPRINSRTHIGPEGMREGAIGDRIRTGFYFLSIESED